jgi:hypothetical protein
MDGAFHFGIKQGVKDFFLLTLEPFGMYLECVALLFMNRSFPSFNSKRLKETLDV